MSVYIIAEAGVNHNGRIDLAKTMVDKAIDAGADCIKFQTFIPEKIVSGNAAKADYQKQQTVNDETQLEMLKKLALSFEEFRELYRYCEEKNIEFISTPFDFESIVFLESLGMMKWKIPSGEITNLPYLEKIAKLGKEVILSSGMSTLIEIEEAINILKTNGTNNITLLHCTSDYPTRLEDVNLRVMNVMKQKFGLEVGYSDHTIGIEVPIAATAMGATVIEKHFTLDKNMYGPDHCMSLEPMDLKEMITYIRNTEVAMGDGVKCLTSSESENALVARKSIVTMCKINSGELFTESNITTKRPGNGVSPMRWYEVVGKRANKDYSEDELIEL